MSDSETLGQRLREAREAKDLTLEDTERITRIRVKFLEALEQGNYSNMSPVQAQGFLRNYARFLGLEYELLLEEIENTRGSKKRRRRRGQETPLPASQTPIISSPTHHAHTARPVRKVTPPDEPRPAYRPARPRRTWPRNLLIIAVAGAALAGLIFVGSQWIDNLTSSSGSDQEVVEAGPSSTPDENALAPGDSTQDTAQQPGGAAPSDTPPSPTVSPTETPQSSFTPPVLTSNVVEVEVTITRSTWLQITVDGGVNFEGQVNPGEILRYMGTESVGVLTRDASAINVIVNNQPMGTLGHRGELFDYTFTLGGAPPPTVIPSTSSATTSPEQATLVSTPSSTPSSTPTPTEGMPDEATATVLPSATPTETLPPPPITRTATPAPSATETVTPSPTSSPTPTISPTLSPTRTEIPSPTISPAPTISPTPTATPSQTPFLPPRWTRTPSPPPK